MNATTAAQTASAMRTPSGSSGAGAPPEKRGQGRGREEREGELEERRREVAALHPGPSAEAALAVHEQRIVAEHRSDPRQLEDRGQRPARPRRQEREHERGEGEGDEVVRAARSRAPTRTPPTPTASGVRRATPGGRRTSTRRARWRRRSARSSATGGRDRGPSGCRGPAIRACPSSRRSQPRPPAVAKSASAQASRAPSSPAAASSRAAPAIIATMASTRRAWNPSTGESPRMRARIPANHHSTFTTAGRCGRGSNLFAKTTSPARGLLDEGEVLVHVVLVEERPREDRARRRPQRGRHVGGGGDHGEGERHRGRDAQVRRHRAVHEEAIR